MMTEKFARMNCYVLAGGENHSKEHFRVDGELTRLEKSYRRYAAVFEKVSLVLKRSQAKERYLNYPHLCDPSDKMSVAGAVAAALERADSEAVFIGSADFVDFPLELAARLVREYDGESFLGYADADSPQNLHQPLFGIYHKKLAGHLLDKVATTGDGLASLLSRVGKLVPLPKDIPRDRVGLG
ncbi:MAG: NTP transferase domain-containing protein [Candidatus Zixiibacteriota bacterium]|nr:MAG: NTP transferase domain-containing protein [candidate division Zixibacteria bacterium]